MDPLGFSSAALVTAGNVASAKLNYKETKKLQQQQFDFARAENQKSRDFTKLSQEWANEQNLAQWNRSNDYNDPIRVRERLSKAGINPDLYYSGGAAPSAASNMPAQALSSSANSSPSVSPASFDFDALEAQRLIAETENIKAQTRQVDEQTGVLSTYAEFQSSLLQGQVDTSKSIVKYNTELAKLPESQIENLRKQNSRLDKSISLMDAQIDSFVAETSFKDSLKLSEDLRRYWYSSEAQSQIDNLESQTSLNKSQAFEIFELLAAKKANLNATSGFYTASGKKVSEEQLTEIVRRHGISIQNGVMSFDLANLRDYNDVRQRMQNYSQLADMFSSIFGSFGDAIKVSGSLKR